MVAHLSCACDPGWFGLVIFTALVRSHHTTSRSGGRVDVLAESVRYSTPPLLFSVRRRTFVSIDFVSVGSIVSSRRDTQHVVRSRWPLSGDALRQLARLRDLPLRVSVWAASCECFASSSSSEMAEDTARPPCAEGEYSTRPRQPTGPYHLGFRLGNLPMKYFRFVWLQPRGCTRELRVRSEGLAHVHAYTHICTHLHLHARVHMHLHVCTCVHLHMHLHMHTAQKASHNSMARPATSVATCRWVKPIRIEVSK